MREPPVYEIMLRLDLAPPYPGPSYWMADFPWVVDSLMDIGIKLSGCEQIRISFLEISLQFIPTDLGTLSFEKMIMINFLRSFSSFLTSLLHKSTENEDIRTAQSSQWKPDICLDPSPLNPQNYFVHS
eukprot:Gb_16602 [translate_table: standard]